MGKGEIARYKQFLLGTTSTIPGQPAQSGKLIWLIWNFWLQVNFLHIGKHLQF